MSLSLPVIRLNGRFIELWVYVVNCVPRHNKEEQKRWTENTMKMEKMK